MRNVSKTLVAQDSYEQAIDGNGDTFNDWYQWVGKEKQFLRHPNSTANALFADTHVDRLGRGELSDERYYTGKW
jgi:prepilin-type processing-associated H-X9-DG protein